MRELFEDDDEKVVIADDDCVEAEEIIRETRQRPNSDARKRLYTLLEERRLRRELEDFFDDER